MWWMMIACTAQVDAELAAANARIVELEAQVAELQAAAPPSRDDVTRAREDRLKKLEELRAARGPTNPAGPDADPKLCTAMPDGSFMLPAVSLSEVFQESPEKLGRALLHRGPDGEYDGYRLSVIRRGGLGDSCGIRNGDVVHAVNGSSIHSMDAAMAMVHTLQEGAPSDVTLTLTRDDAKMDLVLVAPKP